MALLASWAVDWARLRYLPAERKWFLSVVENGYEVAIAGNDSQPDSDRLAAARSDTYLWGRDILVAPVVEPGAAQRRLYLPQGTWYDFWTGDPVGGGREITRPVDLETMPLYVRAGAIVPLGPVKQYTAEPVDSPLTLVVYPGADGRGSIYEDDGHSFGYQRGEWMRMLTEWNDVRRTLRLRLAEGSRRLSPMPRRAQSCSTAALWRFAYDTVSP